LTKDSKKRLIITGGGAAGFFLAANLLPDNLEVLMIEKSKLPLQKVYVSGGGRCNVTHACFDPRELVKYYPRGSKELLSVFHTFQPGDTIEWFESRGVSLYTNEENCLFPSTDSSKTIIDLLVGEANRNGVKVQYETSVRDIIKEDDGFLIVTDKESLKCDYLAVTTGSSRKMWDILDNLGHNIIPPVPSLFSLNCPDELIQDLAGTTFSNVEISVAGSKKSYPGIMLITHKGLSGPAVLSLSAYEARELNSLDYKVRINVNWISENFENTFELLKNERDLNPKKEIYSFKNNLITANFWKNLLHILGVENKLWAEAGNAVLKLIAEHLTNSELEITGRNLSKEEFVTAGGVDLKEVDLRTMQSKLIPNLYFAGEVLNIDGVTGGFNFQACWSEAFIISKQFV
jgi:predicted Rossmann fold flavoprotein